MKTYVITLAKTFMKGHPRAGEPTKFRSKFENAINEPIGFGEKIHTIRHNVPLWKKRIKEVEAGAACLSIREWTGRPYASKQVEIACLTKEDGVGMQIIDGHSVEYDTISVYSMGGDFCSVRDAALLAENDGLSLDDWWDWFDGFSRDEYLAVIHFTKFRY